MGNRLTLGLDIFGVIKNSNIYLELERQFPFFTSHFIKDLALKATPKKLSELV